MVNEGNLTMRFRDGEHIVFDAYDGNKLDELQKMLNGKVDFLSFTLLNKKEVIINRNNIQSIMFEENT